VVPRLAGVLALLCAATFALGQGEKSIKIEFGAEGKREVWIQEKGKLSDLPERTSSSGKAITIDVPEQAKDMVVLVRDVEKNNVATKPFDQVVKTGTWAVTDNDYGYAFVVAFWVKHDGNPVSSAIVHMGDRQELVSVEDEGVAAFHIVPFGDVEVTVDYKSGGEDRTLAAQTFESKKDMGGDPAFTLEITDEVATIEPKPTEGTEVEEGVPAGATKVEEKPEPPKTNPFSTVLNMLIGLAVVGGIAYAVWRFVQSNPDKTKDLLQKGGVPMPDDAQGQATTMTTTKAGPPKQILLDDATPTPAAAPVVDAGPVVKNPRLVKSDGSLYIVQDGEQTVGRESASLTIGGESSVSRTHAKMTRAGDSVTVEDAGSTNGTFVNGQRLSGPRALTPGDTVQFGAVQYRYEE
jgi:hypothetical protein